MQNLAPASSLPSLTFRTKESAARCLDDSLDVAAAGAARLAGAIINTQPFFIEIRRARRAAKIKQPVAIAFAGIVQRHRAAAFNGVPKRFANGLPEASDLRRFQSARGQLR